MLGRAAGGAVRLAPAGETLAVGEGIESSVAAMMASRLPGWAALSTSGLAALILPPVVREVVIAADNDANGAGLRAARAAAGRWLAQGRRVRIYRSPRIGEDAADLVVAAAIEARHAA
jgi:putative DNA primase/helicase